MSIAFSLHLMHIQPSRMVMGLVLNCYLLWEKQEVLLLNQENKKDGWQGWILDFKFYFQCTSSPTLLSLLGLLDLYNCIIHIPGNMSLYSANHSGPNICNQLRECMCRWTLSCVFYSFNKHPLHLVIILYSLCYMLRRARLVKRSSMKWWGMVHWPAVLINECRDAANIMLNT